jgi:hypothetical protein
MSCSKSAAGRAGLLAQSLISVGSFIGVTFDFNVHFIDFFAPNVADNQ